MTCAHWMAFSISPQFEADAEMVGFSLANLVHLCVNLVQDAELVLHMMAYLMRNYVCIRKISACAQLTLHLGEERQVNVQFLVA